MKKAIYDCATAAGAGMILWFLFSWLDIISHNLTTMQYAAWNMFEILIKIAG